MIKDFKVEYNESYQGTPIYSFVYLVDYENNRFLIVDSEGYFRCVRIEDCKLYEVNN